MNLENKAKLIIDVIGLLKEENKEYKNLKYKLDEFIIHRNEAKHILKNIQIFSWHYPEIKMLPAFNVIYTDAKYNYAELNKSCQKIESLLKMKKTQIKTRQREISSLNKDLHND